GPVAFPLHGTPHRRQLHRRPASCRRQAPGRPAVPFRVRACVSGPRVSATTEVVVEDERQHPAWEGLLHIALLAALERTATQLGGVSAQLGVAAPHEYGIEPFCISRVRRSWGGGEG